MRIEDYRHLYLGCEGKASIIYSHNPLIKKEVSATFLGIDIYGKIKCQCRDVEGISWEDSTVLLIHEFKPILRKLNDMTEKEEEEVNFKKIIHPFTPVVYYSPEMFRVLLSKHFDLFNLIENGFAIDAKTLKVKNEK